MKLTYGALVIGIALASVAHADISPTWTTDVWGRESVLLQRSASGTSIRLNWSKPGGGTTSTTVTGNGREQYIKPPEGYDVKNATVTVKDKEGATDTNTAYGWSNHPSYALAYHTVSGGTLSLGGETFALTGSYQVRADSFDLDESSATFGEIQGRFLSGYSNITGLSSGGHTLSFQFAQDQYFTTSVAGALATPGLDGATSSFNIALTGTAVIDGSMFIAFTGTATGLVTYTPSLGDSFESYNVGLTINSSLGASTGTLQSSGIVEVIPTPAAGVLAGLGGVLALRRRR